MKIYIKCLYFRQLYWYCPLLFVGLHIVLIFSDLKVRLLLYTFVKDLLTLFCRYLKSSHKFLGFYSALPCFFVYSSFPKGLLWKTPTDIKVCEISW